MELLGPFLEPLGLFLETLGPLGAPWSTLGGPVPSPNGFWMVFGCFSVARSGPKSEKIREKVQLCFDVEQKTVFDRVGPGKIVVFDAALYR